MSIEFTDKAAGSVRSLDEYKSALQYYQSKIVKPDFSDPGSVLNAPVVIELLKVVIRNLEG